MANLAWRAAWEAEHGRKLGGRKPQRRDPDALAKRRINTTVPDSGFSSAPAVARSRATTHRSSPAPEQVIVAADVTQQSNDSGQLAPMVVQALKALGKAGVAEPIGTVLADGGYWNSPQISEVRSRGIDVLVPIENRTRTAQRTFSARQGPEAERIEAVLAEPGGQALYRRDSRSSSRSSPTPSSSAAPTASGVVG